MNQVYKGLALCIVYVQMYFGYWFNQWLNSIIFLEPYSTYTLWLSTVSSFLWHKLNLYTQFISPFYSIIAINAFNDISLLTSLSIEWIPYIFSKCFSVPIDVGISPVNLELLSLLLLCFRLYMYHSYLWLQFV